MREIEVQTRSPRCGARGWFPASHGLRLPNTFARHYATYQNRIQPPTAYSGGQRLMWLQAEYRSRRWSRVSLSSDNFSFPSCYGILRARMAFGRSSRKRLLYRQCHIDLRHVCTHNAKLFYRFPIILMILLLLCVIWLDPTSRQIASSSIKPKFILFVYTNEVDDTLALFARTSRGRFVIAQLYIYYIISVFLWKRVFVWCCIII